MPHVSQDVHLQLLRLLEANPQVSQRELAEHLGVSLGKANYCLKALITKGLVKARNFRNSDNKRAYLYVLTPQGIEARARLTARFLQRKMAEYEALKLEIEQLHREMRSPLSRTGTAGGTSSSRENAEDGISSSRTVAEGSPSSSRAASEASVTRDLLK